MTINKIKDKLVLAFIFAIFFVTMFGFNQVEAADYNIDDSHYDDKQQKIYDNANLLTTKEEEKLGKSIIKAAQKAKLDIIVVTINDAKGKSSQEYADDFYDQNKFGYEYEYGSGVLLLIDMDNREVYISTSGLGILFINDNYIEKILDNITPYVSSKKYYKCADYFVDVVKENALRWLDNSEHEVLLKKWYDGKYDTDKKFDKFYDKYVFHKETIFTYLQNPLISGIIALIIATITLLCLRATSKTKVSVNGRTYMKNSVNFSVRQDHFTHTTTTKRKIETSSNSSGSKGGSNKSSSTHRSSSGRSHGGGGRKF